MSPWEYLLNPAMAAGGALAETMAQRPGAQRAVQDATLTGMQAVPEWMRNLIAPVVGRVVTNVARPVGYEDKIPEITAAFSPPHLWDTLKAVAADRPAYATEQDNRPLNDLSAARRPLFRAYFGMNPQDDQNRYIASGHNFALNPANPESQGYIDNFRSPPVLSGGRGSARATHGINHNEIVGNYTPGTPDKWDFAPHRSEAVPQGVAYSHSDYLRRLLEAFTGQNAPMVQTNYR